MKLIPHRAFDPLGLNHPPARVFVANPCREHAERLGDVGAIAIGVGEIDVRRAPAAAIADHADLDRVVKAQRRLDARERLFLIASPPAIALAGCAAED